MARDVKAAIKAAMPGYRVVEERARARGLDAAGGDDRGPPPADIHGTDFVKLQEKYLGESNAPRSRSVGLDAAGSGTSKLVTVEKQSLIDSRAVGRKAVIFDEEDDTIVGKQG
jgi:hypothetical protein